MAKDDLKNILSFYKKQSFQGYTLVKQAILENINKAASSPLIFVNDELKKPKEASILTFTVYHTRVSYQVSEDKIIILRLRHTSREPLDY
jgi:plasmid stabilization system protein ParE